MAALVCGKPGASGRSRQRSVLEALQMQQGDKAQSLLGTLKDKAVDVVYE
jgi:hypothetical protein